MVTKISELRAAANEGRWADALAIAAKFPRLGDEKEAITRADAAIKRPDFYRQIRKDPDALVAEGITALCRRYGIDVT